MKETEIVMIKTDRKMKETEGSSDWNRKNNGKTEIIIKETERMMEKQTE